MAEIFPRHLVIVRHGESEGDVRRANRDNGIEYKSHKLPQDEEQTEIGHKQSKIAGEWITAYVLNAYGLESFDFCSTSPMARTRQSAVSLGISKDWKSNSLLEERRRGDIQGLTKQQHQSLFPDSYQEMSKHPFRWVPPNGESMMHVAGRATKFTEKTKNYGSVLVETHRDWIWAAHITLEKMSIDEATAINTDTIHNGQVLHYTNVNPYNGRVLDSLLRWKRSVCPWNDAEIVEASHNWVELSFKPEHYYAGNKPQ